VLWDGECGLCARAARWIERHDAAGRFRVVAYQQAPAPPMSAELREACARAVHVVTADGRVLRGGRASLHVLEHLGWPRLARLLSVPPLCWGVELGYRVVARNRRLFSKLLFRP